jgi:hypothetical protein
MPLGQVLYEPGSTLSHAYFPTTAIVSLLYVMQNGESAEIAVVGNEGVVGVSLFMGGESTSSRALVQSAGGGFRLTAQLMKEEFYRAGPVLHLLRADEFLSQEVCVDLGHRRTIARRRRSLLRCNLLGKPLGRLLFFDDGVALAGALLKPGTI